MSSSAWQVAEAPSIEDYTTGTFQAPERYCYDIEQDGDQVISELAEPVAYVVGSPSNATFSGRCLQSPFSFL